MHHVSFYRYAFLVEYDGTSFSGWQWQNGAVTVQQTLTKAFMGLVGQEVSLFAAGRTDQGVHALGQVFHVDFDKPYSLDRLRRGLNDHLAPHAIRVLEVQPVTSSFHARFSALARTYRYCILNRPSPSPLLQNHSWWIAQPLDLEILTDGMKLMQGHHNFTAFRHRDCQSATPWKTLDSFDLDPMDSPMGPLLTMRVTARSFLHRQVRMMVGALIALSLGRLSFSQLHEWLDPDYSAKQKAPSAPPQGLFFMHVHYGTENPFATLQNPMI